MMLPVGACAPDLTLPDEQGEPIVFSQLYKQPLVLLFVRHLGCPFCRDQLLEMRDGYERIRAAGGEVAAVTMGTIEQAARIKQSLGLPFTCLADSQQEAYRAFEIPRGSLSQVAGPSIWGPGLAALRRGGLGVPRGDLLQLQATLVIDGEGIVRYVHHPQRLGRPSQCRRHHRDGRVCQFGSDLFNFFSQHETVLFRCGRCAWIPRVPMAKRVNLAIG